MPRRSTRLAATLLDLAAVAMIVPLVGGAVRGAAVRTVPVTAASWGAAVAPAGAAPPGGPLPLPWSGGGPTAEALLDVVATGTVPLAAVALVLETDDPEDSAAVAVTACRGGTWDGATCGGEPLELGDLTASTRLEVALEPGERLGLRAVAPRNVANRTAFALRVVVDRSDAREGRRSSG